jgi:hypothetical protein
MGNVVGKNAMVWRSRLEHDFRAKVVMARQTLVTFGAGNSTVKNRVSLLYKKIHTQTLFALLLTPQWQHGRQSGGW